MTKEVPEEPSPIGRRLGRNHPGLRRGDRARVEELVPSRGGSLQEEKPSCTRPAICTPSAPTNLRCSSPGARPHATTPSMARSGRTGEPHETAAHPHGHRADHCPGPWRLGAWWIGAAAASASLLAARSLRPNTAGSSSTARACAPTCRPWPSSARQASGLKNHGCGMQPCLASWWRQLPLGRPGWCCR